MKKSRILLLLLVFVLSLSLFACGEKTPKVTEGDPPIELPENGYVVDTLTINGIDISQFVIVTGDNLSSMEKLMVPKLQEQIARVCGVTIPVVASTEPEAQYEILIGNTGRAATSAELAEGRVTASFADGKIALFGNGEYSITYAIKYFNDVLCAVPTIKSYNIEFQGFEDLIYENPNLAGTNMPLTLQNFKNDPAYNIDFTNNTNVLNKFNTTLYEFPEEVTVLPRYNAEDFPLSMQNQVFVAVDGSDENEGTIDSPLATIEAALKKLDGKNGGVVWVRGGIYNTTVTISSANGTPISPVIISAYADEVPLFTSGKHLNPADFKEVDYATDEEAKRIPAAAKPNVVYVNLIELGWTKDEIGEIVGGSSNKAKVPQLYINSELQHIARYPNADQPELYFDYVYDTGSISSSSEHTNLYAGWAKRTKNWEAWVKAGRSDTASYSFDTSVYKTLALAIEDAKKLDAVKDTVYTDSSGNKNFDYGWQIRMRDFTPCTWVNTGNIWYHGNVFEGWEHGYYNIESFDLASKKMTSKSGSAYGAKHSTNSPTGYNNYYLFNAIECLDAPGEWFYDVNTGNLYIYKTEGFEAADIRYATTTSSAADTITVKSSKNLIVNGLSVSISSGKGICATNSDSVIIQGCSVMNTASYGIHLYSNVRNSAVTYNELQQTGDVMIYAYPNDNSFASMTPSRLIVQNNYCHNPRVRIQGGVTIGGYLSVASHNALDNCQINFTNSSECIVEYNDIAGGSKDVTDAGLIYLVGYFHHGNHIRYNYLHEWNAPGSGVYLDDLSCGHYVYYNIIDSTEGTRDKGINMLYTSSGHYNVFFGNLLVGRTSDYIHESCLYFDQTTSLTYRFPGRVDTLLSTFNSKYNASKFYGRFPEMKAFLELVKQYDTESAKSGYVRTATENYLRAPNNNIIMNNIIIGCNTPIYQPILTKLNTVSGGLMESTDYVDYNYSAMDADTIFVDYKNGDFTIYEDVLPEIEAALSEYTPFTTERMGLTYER